MLRLTREAGRFLAEVSGGWTALMIATRKGFDSLIELLKQHGAEE